MDWTSGFYGNSRKGTHTHTHTHTYTERERERETETETETDRQRQRQRETYVNQDSVAFIFMFVTHYSRIKIFILRVRSPGITLKTMHITLRFLWTCVYTDSRSPTSSPPPSPLHTHTEEAGIRNVHNYL